MTMVSTTLAPDKHGSMELRTDPEDSSDGGSSRRRLGSHRLSICRLPSPIGLAHSLWRAHTPANCPPRVQFNAGVCRDVWSRSRSVVAPGGMPNASRSIWTAKILSVESNPEVTPVSTGSKYVKGENHEAPDGSTRHDDALNPRDLVASTVAGFTFPTGFPPQVRVGTLCQSPRRARRRGQNAKACIRSAPLIPGVLTTELRRRCLVPNGR